MDEEKGGIPGQGAVYPDGYGGEAQAINKYRKCRTSQHRYDRICKQRKEVKGSSESNCSREIVKEPEGDTYSQENDDNDNNEDNPKACCPPSSLSLIFVSCRELLRCARSINGN